MLFSAFLSERPHVISEYPAGYYCYYYYPTGQRFGCQLEKIKFARVVFLCCGAKSGLAPPLSGRGEMCGSKEAWFFWRCQKKHGFLEVSC
jgi:hypothetical protein